MTTLAEPILTVADLELMARVRELEASLHRERARAAGLEQGIEALSARIEDLRRENAVLRGETPT